MGQATTLATMIVSTTMTGALSQVWGLINGLQLIVHLPLVAQATFPEFTNDVFLVIISIAQFDLIDTEAWIYKGIFGIEIPDDYETLHLNSTTKVGYGSTYTMLNLGTLHLIFLIMVVQCILLCICSPCYSIFGSCRNKAQGMKNSLYWNAFLRLILEASLELAITTLNNIRIYSQVDDHNRTASAEDKLPDWYMPEFLLFWINFVTTVGGVIVLALLPLFILFYFSLKFKMWEHHSFKDKFGSGLEGLRKEKRSAVFYPFFFMFRRIIFAIQAVYFYESFASQIFLQIMLTMVQISYLLSFRPFEDSLMQRLEVMNESYTLVLMYIVITFNELWVDDDHARFVTGSVLLTVIAINVFVNFFFLFRTIYFGYEEKVFRKREKANKCGVCIFKCCSKKIRKAEKLRKERNKQVHILKAQRAIKALLGTQLSE